MADYGDRLGGQRGLARVVAELLASGDCDESNNADEQEEEGGIIGGKRHFGYCRLDTEYVRITVTTLHGVLKTK